MRTWPGYIAAGLAGAALALLGARACQPPPPAPGLSPEEIAAFQADRDAAVAHAEARVTEARADADRLRELPLYERIAELVPPDVSGSPRTAAVVSGPAGGVIDSAAVVTPITTPPRSEPKSARGVSDTARGHVMDTWPTASDSGCHPDGPGWARCPEPYLDRLSLLVVDERQRADVAEIRLDEERALRRIDAEEWAAKEAAYVREVESRHPPPAWKLPVGIASGGAIVGGLVLAASGHPEAGLAVAGAGAVGAAVAAW